MESYYETEYSKLTIRRLKNELRKLKLPVSGNKDLLIKRLIDYHRKEAQAYEENQKKVERGSKIRQEATLLVKEELYRTYGFLNGEEDKVILQVPFIGDEEEYTLTEILVAFGSFTNESIIKLSKKSNYVSMVVALESFWRMRAKSVYHIRVAPLVVVGSWKSYIYVYWPHCYVALTPERNAVYRVAFRTYESAKSVVGRSKGIVELSLRSVDIGGGAEINFVIGKLKTGGYVSLLGGQQFSLSTFTEVTGLLSWVKVLSLAPIGVSRENHHLLFEGIPGEEDIFARAIVEEDTIRLGESAEYL
jgi:hypothetical protein